MADLFSHKMLEQAHMQRAALQKAAEHYRLLQQLQKPTDRFLWIRRATLTTGNWLIAGGVWLKQRAALEQPRAYRQPITGNLSQMAGK